MQLVYNTGEFYVIFENIKGREKFEFFANKTYIFCQ